MTKSQNTKNEQLTEQWKKGELPEGHYYVKDGENLIAEYLDGYFYNNGEPMTSFSGGVDEVLAKVPDYDEYWHMISCLNDQTEILNENAKLKEILERHKKATAKAQIRSCDLEIINAQLKELLAECLAHLTIGEYGTSVTPLNILIGKVKEVLR